jgi:hypothetical protein
MNNRSARQPLDLAKYRNLPTILMVVGGVLAALGFFVNRTQFAYSWLLSFMFFLSLGLGGLFLVMVHHLFDAAWSVPIRRINEQLSIILFPTLALLFIPIALLAPSVYPWMHLDPELDHALHAKKPLFTMAGFYITSAFCFLTWWWLSRSLRGWSLKQDKTGGATPTYRFRVYSCIGIILFAITLTLGAVMWMKALMHEWFSTMYGVWYFAGSVWLTLGTVYVITMILDRQRVLTEFLHQHQYYYLGSLMFAFTVFYAYVTFSQYFIIWNANMPEETFWYILREKGTWFWVSMVIIFGHFFIPFLGLLRIDWKSVFPYMLGIAIWAWLMHFIDLTFNIMPVLHKDGYVLHWMDIGCFLFMAGVVATVFLKNFLAHPPYPLKDPRLSEAMGLYFPTPPAASAGQLEATGHGQGGKS